MNVDTAQLAAITDRVSTLEATAAAANQRIAALSACLEAAYHAAGMSVPSLLRPYQSRHAKDSGQPHGGRRKRPRRAAGARHLQVVR